MYLKKEGNIGGAQLSKNSNTTTDYGTDIYDYSNTYNTALNIHDGIAKIKRTDTSGNTVTYTIALVSDIDALKKEDYVVTKNTPAVALQVNENTFTKIFKNAVSGAADYGTSIKDYTNGVQTELKIQNGKMWLDGREVVTK